MVKGWDRCFPHDEITEQKFEGTVFGDPNLEEEGNFVVTLKDKIVGFSAAVAREGIAGRDGSGRDCEKDFGYIKGLFFLGGHRDGIVKKDLLERALNFLKSRGKKTAKIGKYTGIYFFPGIDERYEEELRFYKENGFEEVDIVEDVMLDLKNFNRRSIGERQSRE
ncbi:MAG: hypothetical protein ACUVTL_06295 [Thermoproteota archaeon]